MDDKELYGEVAEENVGEEAGGCDELTAITELNALYLDKIKQQAAEFENYRNRTAKEMGQMYNKGLREAIVALLPVVDNLERALQNVDAADGFAAGVLMIQNQLTTVLGGLGVAKIDAVGQQFDIRYHAAVSHIQDEGLDKNQVVEELQAGYMHGDTVIRHSMVVVAN
ncbi:MAG: nucleotide exchange factor GrpE [Defluviitaleaceae bacterium]|nr:nucleotide exchange factor GrpE [Defluviitaleaceae bacterium]